MIWEYPHDFGNLHIYPYSHHGAHGSPWHLRYIRNQRGWFEVAGSPIWQQVFSWDFPQLSMNPCDRNNYPILSINWIHWIETSSIDVYTFLSSNDHFLNCWKLEIQEIPDEVDLESLPVTFDALHYDEAAIDFATPSHAVFTPGGWTLLGKTRLEFDGIVFLMAIDG